MPKAVSKLLIRAASAGLAGCELLVLAVELVEQAEFHLLHAGRRRRRTRSGIGSAPASTRVPWWQPGRKSLDQTWLPQ